MHRELAQADAVFSRPRTLSLYLFTACLTALLVFDLLPAVLNLLGDASDTSLGREILGLRFATLAAIFGGAHALYRALDRLMDGRIGADLALAIACIAALLIGEPLVAAEVVVIGLIGECLEAYTFGRTQAAIAKVVEVFPQRCWLLRDGREVRVLTKEIRVGDVVIVKPGAKIPVDGVVREGRSALDCSALTGESLPRDVEPGDQVLAGSVNLFGSLTIDAIRVGETTVAGQVIELTARALREKAPIERTADRMASYFLPVVLGLAAITFVAFAIIFAQSLPFSAAARRAVYPALSVLVVACPCPLILATPAAIMAALARLAGTGILVKSGGAIERLSGVQAFAFDKTGTLTEGRLVLGELLPMPGVAGDELLRLAAAAEQGSEHPLARAVVEEARRRELQWHPVSEFTAHPGAGVQAAIGADTILVGSPRLLEAQGVKLSAELTATLKSLDDKGQSALVIARNGVVLGAIGARDQIRPDAPNVIAQLRASGIESLVMLTGDRQAAAHATAAAIGISDVRAELMPDEKAQIVGSRQSGTGSNEQDLACSERIPRATAFIGDGINDAPALARASVGLAVGSGTDLAVECGDIVLMGDPLRSLPLLYRLSRQTVRIIRQNILVFAIGVNLLGVVATAWLWPLLAPSNGWFESGPLAGVIYHQIGSLAVLLNSMRLLVFERGIGRTQIDATRDRWHRVDRWLTRTFDIDEWLHSVSHHWKLASAAIALVLLIGYAASGFAAIGPAEIGIVNRCGRLLPEHLEPGLRWHWPWPIESIVRVRPAEVRTVEIGFRTNEDATDDSLAWSNSHRGSKRWIPDESSLITGDGNLVELLATVRFHIADPHAYLTQRSAPELQLRASAEALLREFAAARPFAELLTIERAVFAEWVVEQLRQRTHDFGLKVDGISIHDLHPPLEVVGAYHNVARAQEERDRQINEALAAAIITRQNAEANALRTTRDAEARAEERILIATTRRQEFEAWHKARTQLGIVDEAAMLGEAVAAILAGGEPESALADYRKHRDDRIAVRRSLTEFRLAWDALAGAMSGRAKVIIDADRVPGRRQLLLFDPGPLAPPIVPRPVEGKR